MVTARETLPRYLAGVMNSRSLDLHRAVERARWLAELAAALDQASKLACSSCRDLRGDRAEAAALREHIDALRIEVDLLQHGSGATCRGVSSKLD